MFALTGYFLIDFSLILAGNLLEIGTLLFYLSISFLTIIYVFYDILFLEIPEIILLIAIVLTAIVVVVQSLVPGVHIIHTLPWANGASEISSIGVVLSIGIIGSLYAIMLKGWKEILDALILFIAIAILYFFSTTSFSSITSIPFIHAIIGVLGIFIFFFLQIVLSRGTWMGEGDLRIAILVGLFLGMTYSFIGMMITYFIGSIIGVTMILYSKYILKHKEVQTQVPFGPFLAIGMFVTLWYTEEIANLISFYL
ncbi:MAG: hypothetical protein H6767_08545 [Candidatus Peribacteria bacterium]|nr:MAG: hypothetical protein H6767_08545 [Candidatus Peribacteria bacterium]